MKIKLNIFTLILIFVSFSQDLQSQIGIYSAFPFVEREYEYIDTNSRSMTDGGKMISYYLNKADWSTNSIGGWFQVAIASNIPFSEAPDYKITYRGKTFNPSKIVNEHDDSNTSIKK